MLLDALCMMADKRGLYGLIFIGDLHFNVLSGCFSPRFSAVAILLSNVIALIPLYSTVFSE
jgi:hypothetical protein